MDKSRDDTGKLVPMRDTYPTARFLGIAACGEFTKPARNLVLSRDIDLFFVPKRNIIDAFQKHGLVMDYPDKSKEEVKRAIADAFKEGLTANKKMAVAATLLEDLGKATVDAYASRVRSALAATPVELRFIENTYSITAAFDSIETATEFLKEPAFDYTEENKSYMYEITYSDGYEFSREVEGIDELRELHTQLAKLHEHMEGLARKRRSTSSA